MFIKESFILILTKTAVIIINVNKKEATESSIELVIPISKPIHPSKIRCLLYPQRAYSETILLEKKEVIA
jgi:hypothetical protein